MHPRRAAPGSLSFFAGRFETEDDPCPATLRRSCPSMGWHLSGGLAVDGADLPSLSEAIWEGQSAIPGETEMMGRFGRYVGKVFDFGQRISQLVDRRKRPRLPTGAIWGSVFFLFVMRQGSLHAMEGQLRWPRRMERIVGLQKPSADRMGEGLGLMDPDQLRGVLSGVNHQG